MSAADCSTCGARVPEASRFCPGCGRSLNESEATTAALSVGQGRRWRLPPARILTPALAAAVGIVMLLAGATAWGLVLLLSAGVLFLAWWELRRRASSGAPDDLGARFSARREVWAARSRGQLGLFRTRRELAELEAERGRFYHDLGRAVFERDQATSDAARARLEELAELIRAKEAEIQAHFKRIDEQVRRAQAGAGRAEPPDPPHPRESA